jgi:hypothetical protein
VPARLQEIAVRQREQAASAEHRRFWRWKDHDAYKQSFERVVRDLTVLPAK